MRSAILTAILIMLLVSRCDLPAQPLAPAYAEWIADQVPGDATPPVPTGYEQDPDQDGQINLLEYALVRDPFVPDSSNLTTIEMWTDPVDGASYPVLRFTRRRFAAGWRIEAEVSEDLVQWRRGPDHLAPLGAPTIDASGETEQVAFRSRISLEDVSRQFLRVHVEAPAASASVARAWIVPDTPNGLHSNQNWHATGSTPSGDIYVAGMDHATNSALFRLPAGADELEYVGDARTASQAALNWEADETAEKFHTRPTWHDGRVFVATLDQSAIDAGYLQERGFHWYAHDVAGDRFLDLSAAEPGGTALEHGGLAAIAIDPKNGRLWGATIPDARLVFRDPVSGLTTDLGRPPAFGGGYSYTGRFMWVDSRSRVYFTGGNPAWGQTEPPSIFGHVHFYDPVAGFGEETDWELGSPTAIETGQWTRDRRSCLVADDAGRFYRFDDAGPQWQSIGALVHDGQWVWVTHLSADGRSSYAVNSGATADGLYEFDTASGVTRRLCSLASLDPALVGRTRHTGYDAWDGDGCFFFTSFPWPADTNLLLTRVDPVRVKVAHGFLPELVYVGVAALVEAEPTFAVYRSGATTGALEVLADLTTWDASGASLGTLQLTLTIPGGNTDLVLSLAELNPPADTVAAALEIIPDGRDYVVGFDRRAQTD